MYGIINDGTALGAVYHSYLLAEVIKRQDGVDKRHDHVEQRLDSTHNMVKQILDIVIKSDSENVLFKLMVLL